MELLRCVKVLSEKYENKSNTASYNLFKVVVTLLSLRHPDSTEDVFLEIFEGVKDALALQNTAILWKLYTQPLLKHINTNPEIWTTVNDNACIFLTILCKSREAFGENLGHIQLILNKLFDKETDDEMKLKTLYILANVFQERDVFLKNAANLTTFLEKMLSGMYMEV